MAPLPVPKNISWLVALFRVGVIDDDDDVEEDEYFKCNSKFILIKTIPSQIIINANWEGRLGNF